MIPPGFELFTLDAEFATLLLLEQIECNVAQDRDVLRCMILANPTCIFPHRYIQAPVQAVLNSPMPAHRCEQRFRISRQTADEVASLNRRFTASDFALRLNHDD